MKRLVGIVAMALASGCYGLDSFVWNGRQCESVDRFSEDCRERHVCTPCEEPYDFERFGIPSSAVTRITVDIAGGETLDSYFIASAGARDDAVLTYAHGNFAGLEHYLNRVGLLYETGAHVFAIDYRGFGKSSTAEEPDEATFMDDTRRTLTTLDAVLEERGLADARRFVYGYSAGALAAIEMAKTATPCGMVLEAPFPSAQAFADTSTFAGVPQSFVTVDAWDNIGKIPDVHAPLLQLHGSADTFIQLALGVQVFDAANEPKKLVRVPGAVHGNGGNDVPTALGDAYVEELRAFLDDRVCARGP